MFKPRGSANKRVSQLQAPEPALTFGPISADVNRCLAQLGKVARIWPKSDRMHRATPGLGEHDLFLFVCDLLGTTSTSLRRGHKGACNEVSCPHALPIKHGSIRRLRHLHMCSWLLVRSFVTLAVHMTMAAKPMLALRHHAVARATSRMFASIIPSSAARSFRKFSRFFSTAMIVSVFRIVRGRRYHAVLSFAGV